jgi:anti-sigma factor ChrR (cupin superfamily)
MYQKVIEQDEVDAVVLDIPGVKIQTLHTDNTSGAMTVLTHIAAGATIPQHWHTSADETVFVLSGDFIEQGKSYGPGAFFVGKAGTSHGPHDSVSGCTVLTTFSAPLDFQMGKPDGETT